MKKIFEKYNKIVFALTVLILLYPTFQKGYIFLLDSNVTPNLSLSDINWATDPIVKIVYSLLAMIFTFGVFQRIYLFAIIFFLGVAGFRLAKRTGNICAQYFAGLFLIFNPFIYARLVEQPGIALGSLFFFWFLIYLLEYLEERRKSNKKLLLASAFTGLAVATFAHSVFFVGVSMVVFLLFDYVKNRDWKYVLKTAAIILSILFIININWLMVSSSGANSRINAVKSFGPDDWEAFRTKAIGGESIYFTALSMQGYWGEYGERFTSIRENPFWILAFWLILLVAIFGAVKKWKDSYVAKALAVIFFIALILDIGISSPLISPLATFLYKHLPLYIGLREPQKWAAVLVFIYAYLGMWGVKHVLELKSMKRYRRGAGFILAILPIIFAFPMIRGMHKHLAPHNFPSGWQEAREFLGGYSNNEKDGKILFLPWHSYLELNFAGKSVTNPAKNYFGKNIIQGNNTEFGKIYSHSLDDQTLAIEKYTPARSGPVKKIPYAEFFSDMKGLGIGKVIVAKAEDWKKYEWLDTIGAKKVLENKEVIIYDLQR